MYNYIKYEVSTLKNGVVSGLLYRVDKERLYDDFCNFETDDDWNDLLREIDDAISIEEEKVYYEEEDDEWLRVLESFEYDIAHGTIPALVEIPYIIKKEEE